MTIFATIQSLLRPAAHVTETPALRWQEPPPMTDDALHGGRARTVRKAACPVPMFLPVRGTQS